MSGSQAGLFSTPLKKLKQRMKDRNIGGGRLFIAAIAVTFILGYVAWVINSLKEPMHSSLHSVVQPAVRIIPAAQKTASTDAAFRRGAMESNKSPPPFPSPPAASDNPSASSRSLWEDRPANKQPGRNSGSQLTFLMPHHGGNLFSWGLPEARIARKGGDNSIPELALPNLKVISIAASRHSAIATSQGHVWTMGHNDSAGGGGHGSKPLSASGQLGRGGTKEPGRVLGEIENEHIVQVATGRYHTVALSDKGVVYSWGLNDQGQLGRAGVGASNAQDPTSCFSGESCHDGQPKKVDQLQGIHIIGLSCSRYNTMALDDQGKLHVFGFDGCADGTLPAKNEAWRARLVKGGLENEKVTAFDAGYTFWIAATRSGSVFTCNHQDDGYAGTLKNKRKPNDAGELGREAFVDKSGFSPYLPERVKGELEGKHIVAVAAGREHALAVDSEGRVFGWGGREDVTGRVRQALGPSLREPGQLEGDLKGDKILFVAAGEYFSLAASANQVYGWGGNDYLSVGVGRGNPVQVLKNGRDRGIVKQPSKVAGPLSSSSYTILGIAAGFQHSLAIASEPSDKERVDRAHVVNEKPFAKPLTVNAPSEKVEEKKAAIAEKVADKVVDNQKAHETKEEKATVVVEKKKEEARVDKAAIAAKETKVDKAAIIAKERKEATVVAQESEVTDPFGADPSYDNPLEVDGYYYEDYDDYEEEEDWSGYEDDEEDIYGDELYADTYTDDFFTEGNKADKAAQSTVVDGKQATNETVADKEDRLWREEEVSLLGEGAVMEVGDLYLEEGYADLDGKEASADKASASSANATSAALIGVQSKSSDHWRRHVLYASVQAPKNIADIKWPSEVWSNYKKSPKHDAIVQASPDVFKFLPEFFSSRFRNPCWFLNTTLRCIPSYHILGVSKCGTTDIYNRLIKHPHIYESLNKGPHWWDECPWPVKGNCTAPPTGDFEGYINLFSKAAVAIEKDPMGITGEASSNTFTAARGVYLRGPTMTRTDLNVTMPELLREASPFLRLIVIFRNPVDRYFSAYYYYRWWKKDEPQPGPEEFHKTVVSEIKEWEDCVKEKGQGTCVRLYNPQQLVKGMYSEFLDDWLASFPRDQMLFLRNEDYKVAQEDHMKVIFQFLGSRELNNKEMETVMKMPAKNVGSKREEMLPKTRKMLEDFYAPFNQRLAQKLGDERYLWLNGGQEGGQAKNKQETRLRLRLRH